MVVQPEYAGIAVHEGDHMKGRNHAVDEAAAVALGIFAAGGEKDILNIVYGNSDYNDVAANIALMNEAVHSDGRAIFGLLTQLERVPNLNFPTLLRITEMYLAQRERQFLASGISAHDYLVGSHRVSGPVADIAIEEAGMTREEVYRNNCDMLKLHIGAFKALVVFYHINVQIPLPEAIRRVEEMFSRGEALDIAMTLHDGGQEVATLLREANVDAVTRARLLRIMIENGPCWSTAAKREVPALIRWTGKYGPRGAQILKEILADVNFFTKMALGGRVFFPRGDHGRLYQTAGVGNARSPRADENEMDTGRHQWQRTYLCGRDCTWN
jgi:hypothetical protein